MVRSTFFGLEIGRTGLSTAQFGLDVTGHNIANLDTDGYTRQRIVSTAYDPYATIGRFAPVNQALVGGGVRVQILDQIRSAYLDRRFRDETTTHAFWDTRAQSMSYIESFFDNVNEKTSINYSLSAFFESMKIVAEDPVSGAPRTLMQTAAMDLVQQLHSIYDGLIDFQKVENKAVATKTNDINRIAEGIAELNKAIYSFEITGLIANDLRDKRNLLIDDLTRYIDIEYEEYPDPFGHSMLRINIAGVSLVDHDRFNTLGVAYVDNVLGPDEEKRAIPYWMHMGGPELATDDPPDADLLAVTMLDMSRIRGGELKAHIGMRDGLGGGINTADRGVPYYIEMINDLARALVQEINSQHINGWSDNPEDGSNTNILFFDVFDANGDSILAGPDGLTANPAYIQWVDENGDPAAEGDPGAVKIFVIPPGEMNRITAKNISLSQMIQDSAYNIAASSTPVGRAGEGVPIELQGGNNVNMNLLYDIFRKTDIEVRRMDATGEMFTRNVGSLDDYATTIRFDVGSTLHTAKQSAETSRILALAARNQKTAIAGVSLDEEMVGLVRYNHAYNGAARVITQMDDALDRLINGTGRVGL